MAYSDLYYLYTPKAMHFCYRLCDTTSGGLTVSFLIGETLFWELFPARTILILRD